MTYVPWLEGLPTIAQPPTGLQRVATWASRHRVELVASMTGLILLAAIAVGILAADPKRLMERRLARGESVELIGESGVPKWYRWECTPATLGVSDRDSSCCFQTTSMTALVLVDDPQAESYRFTAEIRHDNSRNKNGTVGLHIGPRVCLPPRGVGHVSFRLTFQFNDYWNTVEPKTARIEGTPRTRYVGICEYSVR